MIAAVRVRGGPDVEESVSRHLDEMGLGSVNNCTVMKDNPSNRGRLEKTKDYVTWGELDEEGAEVLLGRAEVSIGKTVDDGNLAQVSRYGSLEELAADLVEGDATLKEAGLNDTVRLHSPRKGYDDTRSAYPQGSLGDRGEAINDLLRRMR